MIYLSPTHGGAAASPRKAAQVPGDYEPGAARKREGHSDADREQGPDSCGLAGSASARAKARRKRSSTLQQPLVAIVASAEYRAMIEKTGSIATSSTPQELGQGDRADTRRSRFHHPGIWNAPRLTSPSAHQTKKNHSDRRNGHEYQARIDAPALPCRHRRKRCRARPRRSNARIGPARDHPPRLPDQHLGHADLLSLEVRRAGKARR